MTIGNYPKLIMQVYFVMMSTISLNGCWAWLQFKHLVDESPLWGVEDCCHIVFFSKVPCVNFNHVIIMKDFHNFLHIMVGQNPKKLNTKKITFLNFISCDVKTYLCQKYICHIILKNANILKN
jgi:hypothetical protein